MGFYGSNVIMILS